MNIKPLNHNLLIQRNRKESVEGCIIIPDRHIGFVDCACKILDVGQRTDKEHRGEPCSEVLRPGDIVLHEKMTEGSEIWKHPDDPSVQIIRKSDVFAFMRGDSIRAFGRKVLVTRILRDINPLGLLLPEDHQSLLARFISLGISDDPFKTNDIKALSIGDTIKIQGWHESIHEISIKHKRYLIVPEELIECSYTGFFKD